MNSGSYGGGYGGGYGGHRARAAGHWYCCQNNVSFMRITLLYWEYWHLLKSAVTRISWPLRSVSAQWAIHPTVSLTIVATHGAAAALGRPNVGTSETSGGFWWVLFGMAHFRRLQRRKCWLSHFEFVAFGYRGLWWTCDPLKSVWVPSRNKSWFTTSFVQKVLLGGE